MPSYPSIQTLERLNLIADFFRNSIINGNFDVWQRGPTHTPTDDNFTADRWNLLTETNGAWTIARDNDAPTGSTYSAKLTNVTPNNQVALVYLMERLDAKKLTGREVSLSFQAKTTASEIANLRATVLAWTGTADNVLSDVIGTWAQNGTDPTWASNWTAEVPGSNKSLTDSWQTFSIEDIQLDTASTNNLAVVIWVDDGTIAAGDDFWITQVQLNEGRKRLPFAPKLFSQVYEECLRYFQKSFAYDTVPAQNAGTVHGAHGVQSVTTSTSQSFMIGWQYQGLLFRIPDVTLYNPSANNAQARNINANADCSNTGYNTSHSGQRFGFVGVTTASTGASGNVNCICYAANAEL